MPILSQAFKNPSKHWDYNEKKHEKWKEQRKEWQSQGFNPAPSPQTYHLPTLKEVIQVISNFQYSYL